jgi:50S ribosomal protein L16 3-hydroxylase
METDIDWKGLQGIYKGGADYNRPMKTKSPPKSPALRAPATATKSTLRSPLRVPTPLLGGISPEEFIRDYWQKKPLLVRGAVPGFGADLSKADMLDLCSREDVESRFVTTAGSEWQLRNGPFSKRETKTWLTPWSVLVQSVNLVFPFGEDLIRRFDFIPYARLDDLMVSYATDGGGVGPHFDNYDVFLLQGSGTRRWRIGRQKDKTLIDGLPLRILKNFTPTYDWLLEPGDMLYLPPDWAHDGIAVGECMTWSIGFRAPPAQELADQFLTYLQESLCIDGIYSDPDLTPQTHPAEISGQMIDRVAEMLQKIQWKRQDVQHFLGSALTEPKPHVFFDHPETPLSAKKFAALIAKEGVSLDARTQMLFCGGHFYLNGERIDVPSTLRTFARELADRRHVPAVADAEAATLIYGWYLDGFLNPGV